MELKTAKRAGHSGRRPNKIFWIRRKRDPRYPGKKREKKFIM